jgi:hypothetical protein
MDEINKFFSSGSFELLSEEAGHNVDALELLETIDIIISSAIFFYELNEQTRYKTEINNLKNITNLINNLYEK